MPAPRTTFTSISSADAASSASCGVFLLLHHLQYLTSFEGGAGHEGDGLADVAALHADHVGVLVVPEVGDLLRLLQPRVPDHRVRKVVLLQTKEWEKSSNNFHACCDIDHSGGT